MKISTIGSVIFPHRNSSLSLLQRFWAWQGRMSDRAAFYRTLSNSDEHILHDIGLSRADLESEITKPFWRV